jgi:hypothetical protein
VLLDCPSNCQKGWIGDGICQEECNNIYCQFDKQDCFNGTCNYNDLIKYIEDVREFFESLEDATSFPKLAVKWTEVMIVLSPHSNNAPSSSIRNGINIHPISHAKNT